MTKKNWVKRRFHQTHIKDICIKCIKSLICGHIHFWQIPIQNIFDQLLIFVIIYQHAKNQLISSVHSSDTVNFRDLSSLAMLNPKFSITFCVKLYQHAKNHLTPSVHSWDSINFRVQRPDWPHPFFTIPNQKKINLINFNFREFLSTCKK